MIPYEAPSWKGQLSTLLEGFNSFYGANLILNSDVDRDT